MARMKKESLEAKIKKAEEKVRVKHSVNSCVDDLVRAVYGRLLHEILLVNAPTSTD